MCGREAQTLPAAINSRQEHSTLNKIALKLKFKVKVKHYRNFTIAHIYSKLHEFLICSFSVFLSQTGCTNTDTHIQTDAAKTINCVANTAGVQGND